MRSLTPREINIFRERNYHHHYKYRNLFLHMDALTQAAYRVPSLSLPAPKLTMTGSTGYEQEQMRIMETLANQYQLDTWMLNRWYTTDEGWQDFQRQWENLPELLSTACGKTPKPRVKRGEVIHS